MPEDANDEKIRKPTTEGNIKRKRIIKEKINTKYLQSHDKFCISYSVDTTRKRKMEICTE